MLLRNLHGCQCDAVQGNCALHSGLLRRIYKEVATLEGQPSVCLFLQLEIFYDSVFAQAHRTGTRARFLQAAAVHSHASVPQRAYRPFRGNGGAKHAARILAAPWEVDLLGWYCTTLRRARECRKEQGRVEKNRIKKSRIHKRKRSKVGI